MKNQTAEKIDNIHQIHNADFGQLSLGVQTFRFGVQTFRFGSV
jgi:hypothetical protein